MASVVMLSSIGIGEPGTGVVGIKAYVAGLGGPQMIHGLHDGNGDRSSNR